MFKILRGILEEKKEFVFDNFENSFEEFLTRYYSENDVPKEIILNGDLSELLKKFLSLKRGSSVKITVPIKGEKKRAFRFGKRKFRNIFFSRSKQGRTTKKRVEFGFFAVGYRVL